MKKFLLLGASASLVLSAMAQDEVWQLVSSDADIDLNAEYVLGYHEIGANISKPFVLMSKDVVASGLTQLGAVTSGMTFNEEAGTVTGVPETAAILRLETCGAGYGIKVTNAATPGYLSNIPGKNNMKLTDTPNAMGFTYYTADDNYDAEAGKGFRTTRIVYLDGEADGKNEFTWTTYANFSIPNGTQYFMFMNQAAPGDLGLYKKVSGTPAPTPAYTYTVDPANGSSLSELTTFTVTFDGVTDINVSEDDDYTFSATMNGATANLPTTRYSTNSITFAYSVRNPLNGTGAYKFVVDGAFVLTLADGSSVPAQFEVNYNVGAQEPVTPDVTWTAEPANGSTVQTLPLFTITWEGVSAISIADDNAEIESMFNGNEVSINPSGLSQNPMVIQFMRQYPNAEGTYTFRLSEGALQLTKADGTILPSPALEYTVNLTGAPKAVTLVANPANDSQVSNIDKMTVTFENASSLALGEGIVFASLDGSDIDDPTVTVSGNVATITFVEPVTTPGLLEVICTDGAFTYTDASGQSYDSTELYYSYTVMGEKPEMPYTVSPEGGKYKVFPTVVITYTGASSVDVPAGATASLSIAGTPSYTFDLSGEGNTVIAIPREAINQYSGSEYTKYVLSIAADTYTVTYGETAWGNREVSIDDFSIAAPSLEFTVTPAPGEIALDNADQLKNLIITFPTGWKAGCNTMKMGNYLYKVDAAGELEQVAKYNSFGAKATDNVLTVPLSGADDITLELGNYRVVLQAQFVRATPPGSTILNGEAYTWDYSVVDSVAVRALFEENPDVVIYTLQGVRVKAADLKELPAGLYIVNGKKVVR